MGGGKGIWGEVGVEYGEKEERKEGSKEGKMNPRTTELIHNRITRSIDKSDILQNFRRSSSYSYNPSNIL